MDENRNFLDPDGNFDPTAQNAFFDGTPQQDVIDPQPGFVNPQPGYMNPQQPGYMNPQQPGYMNPQQPGYMNPQQPGYMNPQQPGYMNPQQPGYMNPQQPGFINPQQGFVNPMNQQGMVNRQAGANPMGQMPTKFCQYCGSVIPAAAVICTNCGCQTGQMQTAPQNIVIQNTNTNTNTNMNTINGGRAKNKWVAFLLCLFLGYLGVHKFYEGKIFSGLLYLFTFGLGGFGWLIDCLILLLKPNPYYV